MYEIFVIELGSPGLFYSLGFILKLSLLTGLISHALSKLYTLIRLESSLLLTDTN
jgi:hypothetical protein